MDSAADPRSRRRHVLIVEDHLPSASAIQRLLMQSDITSVIAATQSQAEQNLSTPFDCILVDLMLPDGSGVDLLKSIRQRHLKSHVAVITASVDRQLIEGAMALRPEGFFRKPLDFTSLLSWINAAV